MMTIDEYPEFTIFLYIENINPYTGKSLIYNTEETVETMKSVFWTTGETVEKCCDNILDKVSNAKYLDKSFRTDHECICFTIELQNKSTAKKKYKKSVMYSPMRDIPAKGKGKHFVKEGGLLVLIDCIKKHYEWCNSDEAKEYREHCRG